MASYIVEVQVHEATIWASDHTLDGCIYGIYILAHMQESMLDGLLHLDSAQTEGAVSLIQPINETEGSTFTTYQCKSTYEWEVYTNMHD